MKTQKNLLTILVLTLTQTAQATNDTQQIDQQQNTQYQQQLERIKQEQQQQQIHLATPQQSVAIDIDKIITNETPCFNINELKVDLPTEQSTTRAGRNIKSSIKHLTQGKNRILHKCIGETGLNQINHSIQNQLLKKGYITSISTIEPQDLKNGTLTIRIIPGKVNQIVNSDSNKRHTSSFNAVVSRPNDILNLRDIETSLENFRLAQSVATNIDIEPSNKANDDYGYSDLVIHQSRHNPLSFQLSIDDSGNDDSGKYQATLSTTLDNPLNSNDVLDISYTHSIDPWNNTKDDAKNNSLYISYQYPFRNWQLNLSHSQYDFNQTLAGLNNKIIYSGETVQHRGNLERIIHRDNQSTTRLNIGGYHKESKNFFDDTEIEVQRKRTSGWTAGLSHQRQTNFGNINASLNYEKGTGAFKAIPSPETFVSNAEAQPSIIKANIGLSSPFQFGHGNYTYRLNWRGQYSKDELISQDRFGIGGRYNVRGFESEILSGERGMLLQQEIARTIPLNAATPVTLQPYITLDQGKVSGISTEYLAGKYLMGGTLGLRIYANNFSLDSFIGKGIKAPKQVETDSTAGFRMSIYY